jgi:hypothetical protein
VTRSSEDPLVAKAFDGKQHEELARAVAQLSPEDAAFFLHRLEAALRKRKIQLGGYLVAMLAWLVGMVLALIYDSLSDSSALWAFLVPFGIVGAVLYGFGAWAERVGKAGLPSAIATSAPMRTAASASAVPADAETVATDTPPGAP